MLLRLLSERLIAQRTTASSTRITAVLWSLIIRDIRAFELHTGIQPRLLGGWQVPIACTLCRAQIVIDALTGPQIL